MNIGKAFSYPFEDTQWANKLGLGLLIFLVPILDFVGVGYIIEIVRRVKKDDLHELPTWDDMGKKFMDGLWLFLAGLIYALPMLILLCLPLVLILVPALLAGNSDSESLLNTLGAVGGISLVCLSCILTLYSLAYSVVYPGIFILYAREGTFAACFKLREIFALIRKNAGSYFTAWGIYLGITLGASLVASLIGGVFGLIPCLGTLVAYAIGLAAGLYVSLIFAHLFGQVSRLDAEGNPLVPAV